MPRHRDRAACSIVAVHLLGWPQDRVPAAKQPPAMPCAKAKQLVRERGGRLLYMPGPDLK